MVENTVHALGICQNYMPGQQATLGGNFASMAVSQVAEQLGIPAHAIWFYAVGGKRVPPDYRLSPGEELTIHSPVDGG